jgi:hypothetical protein
MLDIFIADSLRSVIVVDQSGYGEAQSQESTNKPVDDTGLLLHSVLGTATKVGWLPFEP